MGALLDSHALYWFVSEAEPLSEQALVAIAEAQATQGLFVSPTTAWEMSVAAQKPPRAGRPDLGRLTPGQWFRAAVAATGASVVPIKQRIALEAAEVVAATGHKDPGDAFLIATARVRRIPLITRDQTIQVIARDRPGYLDLVAC